MHMCTSNWSRLGLHRTIVCIVFKVHINTKVIYLPSITYLRSTVMQTHKHFFICTLIQVPLAFFAMECKIWRAAANTLCWQASVDGRVVFICGITLSIKGIIQYDI